MQHCIYATLLLFIFIAQQLLCNINFTTYAAFNILAKSIIIVPRTLSASRLCPPGQYLLADSVRLDSVSGVYRIVSAWTVSACY